MKYILIISFFLISTLSVSTVPMQDDKPCNCCTEEYRQFDFWIGDWMVFDTANNLIGNNEIVLAEGGCVLQENWKSASSQYTGTSYTYFDNKDQTWNQLWIDNQGSNLKLKGRREANVMILKSDLIEGKKVDFYYNQISWSIEGDGSVIQLWELFDKNGNLLNTAFKGIYKQKESTSYNISKVSIYNTTSRRAELLY